MSIKDSLRIILKRSWYGEYIISLFHCIQSKIMPLIISDENAVKAYYSYCTGKELNISNPVSFTEKLNWYKLNDRNPLMTICADKYSVREYVVQNGLKSILNNLIAVYDSVKDIRIDELPLKFVIKATHGSHMNVIVKDKGSINWKKTKAMMNTWLHQNIYWCGREWAYKDIKPRIIVEEYLEDETGGLTDYKFCCFHGEPKYLEVDLDRYSDHICNYYDMDWNLMPLESKLVHNNPNIIIKKPVCFDEMKRIARILSKPFDFVRVDLYEVKGKIYFGELTFYQDGGYPGYPDEYDKMIGEYWNISKKKTQ